MREEEKRCFLSYKAGSHGTPVSLMFFRTARFSSLTSHERAGENVNLFRNREKRTRTWKIDSPRLPLAIVSEAPGEPLDLSMALRFRIIEKFTASDARPPFSGCRAT